MACEPRMSVAFEIVIEIMFAPNYMVQTSQVFETCEVSDELNKNAVTPRASVA
jgi:hypothetical protein